MKKIRMFDKIKSILSHKTLKDNCFNSKFDNCIVKYKMKETKKINFSFILFILFIPIFSAKNILLRKINNENEIILTIKSYGGNGITIYDGEINTPDEIIINGVKQTEINKRYKFPDGDNNTAILRWNTAQTTCKDLFYNLANIVSIDLSHFDSSQITDIQAMFYKCKNLKSINFDNFGTSLVQQMERIFWGCESLTSIDLSNFDTTLVTNMREMFQECTSLTSIDLSNFNTYSLEAMDYMFYKCTSLVSVDLSNFNTTKLKEVSYAFYDCSSLIFINFKSFKEVVYTNAGNIFSSNLNNLLICIDKNNNKNIIKSIKDTNPIIDCSNACFQETGKIIVEKKKCIDDCSKDDTYKYEYNKRCFNYPIEENNIHNTQQFNGFTDKYNFDNSETIKNTDNSDNSYKPDNYEITEILNVISETTIISVNIEKSETNELSLVTDTSENNEQSEIIINSIFTEDINNSEKSENYRNSDSEFNDNFDSTKDSLKDENNESIITDKEITERSDIKQSNEVTDINEKSEKEENTNNIIETEIITSKIKNNNSIKLFNSVDFFKGISESENNLINEDEIIENIKEGLINGDLDSLLSNVTDGEKKDLIAKDKDKNIIYQITTTENQKNNEYKNISTINLGYCEDRLKDIYKIDKNLSLIIFKIDYYKTGLLIPVVGYEIYHPLNKSQLNLSHCKDILVKLNISVLIEEDNLFKYDPTSEYYTDECYTYTTENGTDILINDRKNEFIDKNLSLCENNCSYKGYDLDTKKALCECEMKPKIGLISEIITDENILANNFSSTSTSSSNIITIKCLHSIFTKKALITNIANYILIFSFIFFTFSSIIFYKCGYQLIETNIKNILSKNKKNKRNKNSKSKIDIYGKNIGKNKKSKTREMKKNKKISNPKKKSIKSNYIKYKKEKPNLQKSYSCSSQLELNNNSKNKAFPIKYHKNNNNKIYRKIEKQIILTKYNIYELNYLPYDLAISYDKRTFCQYYLTLFIYKNIFLFAFYSANDYNLKLIKIGIFLLSFDIYFAINIFLFSSSTIHQIYEKEGAYDFKYFLPIILGSFFISYYAIAFIKYLSLSQRNFLELKTTNKKGYISDKASKVKKCLLIKYIIFYILSFILLTIFWLYLSSFCAIFQNSQIFAIKNTFISFGISLFYPLIFNFLPCSLRFLSLTGNKPKNDCIYKISQIFQFF